MAAALNAHASSPPLAPVSEQQDASQAERVERAVRMSVSAAASVAQLETDIQNLSQTALCTTAGPRQCLCCFEARLVISEVDYRPSQPGFEPRVGSCVRMCRAGPRQTVAVKDVIDALHRQAEHVQKAADDAGAPVCLGLDQRCVLSSIASTTLPLPPLPLPR